MTQLSERLDSTTLDGSPAGVAHVPELEPMEGHMTTEPTQLVLVMVGTDHHPFDRMVEWIDEWLGGRPTPNVRVVVQHGSTTGPRKAEGRDFVPRQELDALIAEASVVVCHGGPSTIVETRRRGLVPIVLARSARLGEHVDDHQQRFARAMSERGLIQLVADRDSLFAALDAAVLSPLLVAAGAPQENPAESAARLGALVDRLVAANRARPSRWRRRTA